VDSNLRVIGLENVLIADASVMPEVVAGNTNAPTMMIADVAADRIMGDAQS
jgi:choline dehydrogenase